MLGPRPIAEQGRDRIHQSDASRDPLSLGNEIELNDLPNEPDCLVVEILPCVFALGQIRPDPEESGACHRSGNRLDRELDEISDIGQLVAIRLTSNLA